jgi:uncharacterized membrane protein YhhN
MLTNLLFIAVLVTAVVDWAAVSKSWKKTEYIAKPLTMVLLFGYLAAARGFGTVPLICFGLGILFSLAGDIFLMFTPARSPDRWFVPGLTAFLLAHVAYIFGLNLSFGYPSPLWAIVIGILLALTTARVLRRILAGLREKGSQNLIVPVVTYGTVITLMLLSAILTIYRAEWKTSAAGLVSLGAILFYFSDVILAWNKFVNPIRNGRVVNMVAYHLGQIALIAGAVIQFAKAS